MKGKVALITGGGSGLGASIARRFSGSSGSVVLTGRREAPIKAIAEETGGRALPGDVMDKSHLSEAVEMATGEFGGLNVVIANAGIISAADMVSIKEQDWQQMLDINLTGVLNIVQAAIPP